MRKRFSGAKAFILPVMLLAFPSGAWPAPSTDPLMIRDSATGTGRIADIDTLARTLTLMGMQYRISVTATIHVPGRERGSVSMLRKGMKIRYTLSRHTRPGQPPEITEIRVLPD